MAEPEPVLTDYYIWKELRYYLVTQNLVRAPEDSSTLPPCVVDPDDGPPEPRSGEWKNDDITVAIFITEPIPQPKGQQWYVSEQGCDIVIRSIGDSTPGASHKDIMTAKRAAWALARSIQLYLADQSGITIGEVYVNYINIYSGWSRLASSQGFSLRLGLMLRLEHRETRKLV